MNEKRIVTDVEAARLRADLNKDTHSPVSFLALERRVRVFRLLDTREWLLAQLEFVHCPEQCPGRDFQCSICALIQQARGTGDTKGGADG